ETVRERGGVHVAEVTEAFVNKLVQDLELHEKSLDELETAINHNRSAFMAALGKLIVQSQPGKSFLSTKLRRSRFRQTLAEAGFSRKEVGMLADFGKTVEETAKDWLVETPRISSSRSRRRRRRNAVVTGMVALAALLGLGYAQHQSEVAAQAASGAT